MSVGTRDDLANKIEWEGGLEDAFEYGIAAEDMPDDELRMLWSEAEVQMQVWHATLRRISELLPEVE